MDPTQEVADVVRVGNVQGEVCVCGHRQEPRFSGFKIKLYDLFVLLHKSILGNYDTRYWVTGVKAQPGHLRGMNSATR